MRAGDAPRMSIDWERFRGGIQDWMKHWSAEIRGASNGK
jgi:hypothetical protein